MGQTEIIDKYSFDTAKRRKSDVIKKMDELLFRDGSESLLEMDVVSANAKIAEYLKHCANNDTIPGSFRTFANCFSDGRVKIDYSDTIMKMVSKIMSARDTIWNNIEKM